VVLEGRSLFCLGEDNGFRVAVAKVVDTQLFEYVILMAIIVSSIALAVDEPGVEPNSGLGLALLGLNWVFTVLFSIELVLKVIVQGFIFAPQAYMKSNWNLLDCFIVIVSIVSLTGNSSWVKSLRTLRSLRPLRTIKRWAGLKVVVNALLACMPSFINILIISLLFYLVFAIVAVQTFAGKFWACYTTDGDGETVYATKALVNGSFVDVNGVETCTGTSNYGTGMEWQNAVLHFDNVYHALLTLFEVASLEIWLDVLYSAMDAPSKIGQQPSVYRTPQAALYFIVFIMVGSFLIMNLFVGAVVDNFNREKEAAEGSTLMSPDQEEFVDQLRVMLNEQPVARPQLPQGEGYLVAVRRWCFRWVMWDTGLSCGTGKQTGKSWDRMIRSIIMANVLLMSCYYWSAPDTLVGHNRKEAHTSEKDDYHLSLEALNLMFTLIFVLEFIVKHLALGFEQYWTNGWNKVDGFVVLTSILGFLIEMIVGNGNNADLIRFIHALRVVRIIRLLRMSWASGCMRLLQTLLYTIPSLANTSALLLLVLFIYTTLGMSFFGDMPMSEKDNAEMYSQYPYQLYNEHANFRYFHTGMLTLFRMSTGESWNGIMHDCEYVHPGSWIFFVSYMMLVSYIMFNLLIAIVLEQFAFAMKQDGTPVRPDHMHNFAVEWARFDPECTHIMSSKDLAVMLKRLEPPLGLKAGSRVHALSESLHIPCHKGQVHYVETITALIRYAYDLTVEDEALQMSVNLLEIVDPEKGRPSGLVKMSNTIAEQFPSLLDFVDDDEFLQTYAAMRMQATLRGHHTRGTVIPEKKQAKKQAMATAADTAPVKWAQQSPNGEASKLGELPAKEADSPVQPQDGVQIGSAKGSRLRVESVVTGDSAMKQEESPRIEMPASTPERVGSPVEDDGTTATNMSSNESEQSSPGR